MVASGNVIVPATVSPFSSIRLTCNWGVATKAALPAAFQGIEIISFQMHGGITVPLVVVVGGVTSK